MDSTSTVENRINLLIGGDLVPTQSNASYFMDGSVENIFPQDVMRLFEEADLFAFNLETPLAEKRTPIEKEGPCFFTWTKCVEGIKKMHPSVVTLANNHILDQGEEGLYSTMRTLHDASIPFLGVGRNSQEAARPFYINVKGKTICIYGCVEHEYSCATPKHCGANAFVPFDSIDQIREASQKSDILIVLYHGGKEYYEYPSPNLQRRCRKMVEAGADVILCQHSHCIGTYEEYKNGKILYGQGNLLLDQYVKAYEKYFSSGLLIQIVIEESTVRLEFIPIMKNGPSIRLANEEEKKKIISEIMNRTTEIQDPEFVESHFKEYVMKYGYRYSFRISRLGYIISSIDNRFFGGKILNRNYKYLMAKHRRLALENSLQCEVHNEVIRTFLSNR